MPDRLPARCLGRRIPRDAGVAITHSHDPSPPGAPRMTREKNIFPLTVMLRRGNGAGLPGLRREPAQHTYASAPRGEDRLASVWGSPKPGCLLRLSRRTHSWRCQETCPPIGPGGGTKEGGACFRKGRPGRICICLCPRTASRGCPCQPQCISPASWTSFLGAGVSLSRPLRPASITTGRLGGGGRMTDPSMSLPHDIRTPGRVSSRRGLHWEEAGNSQGGNAAASLAVTRLLPVSSWVAVERVRAACYCFLPTQRVPRLGGGTDESPGESPGRASWPAVEALRLHRGFSPEISDAPAERSVGHDGVSIDSSTARSRPSQAVDLVGFQSRAAAALPGFP